MKYPNFIKEGDIIGVTAPSAGSENDIDLNKIKFATEQFNKIGYYIKETDNCRKNKNGRSSSSKERAKELEELLIDNNIKAIIGLAGGEFLLEMMSYVNLKAVKNNPKWIQGFSDITGLLFPITTICDISTIYGNNFKTFAMKNWHQSLIDNINILEGKISIEKSYETFSNKRQEYIIGNETYELDTQVFWKNLNDEKKVNIKGRIIGGCIDIIENIIGTKFDNITNFIEKYKNDGIVWYFDNCELSSEDIVRTMWQFKEAGYFKYTKGIIFGRNGVEESSYGISFEEALKESLLELNVPIIINTDISHKRPLMSIINGAIAEVNSEKGKGYISFKLI